MPPFFATDNVLPDAAAAVVVVADEPDAGEVLELVELLLDEDDPPHPAAIRTAANRTVETSFEGFTVFLTDAEATEIARSGSRRGERQQPLRGRTEVNGVLRPDVQVGVVGEQPTTAVFEEGRMS
ncbi:MAG: hypothetical protein QOD92_2085 [Acidimicrobiaceae bacterium]